MGGGGRDRERKSFVPVFLMYAPCARLRSGNYSLLLFSLSEGGGGGGGGGGGMEIESTHTKQQKNNKRYEMRKTTQIAKIC